MRYDDWDVILFPKDSHVPTQEFKTACYVSQEECNQLHFLAFTGPISSKIRVLTIYRWAATTNLDLLHQLSSAIDPVSHINTFMGYGGESLADHRVAEKSQPKGCVFSSGHRRWSQSLVSYTFIGMIKVRRSST